MTSGHFHCPSCRSLLKTPEPVPAGTKIKCPQCANIFAAPYDTGPIAAAPEQVTPHAPAPPPPPAFQQPAFGDVPRDYARGPGLAGLSNRYTIDLGEWFNYGTAHYTAVVGPMIGYLLIWFGIQLVASLLGIMIPVLPHFLKMVFADGALNAGFAIVALHQLQGRTWTFPDFFAGFSKQYYLVLLGYQSLVVLASLVATIPLAFILGLCAASGKPLVVIPAVLVGLAYLGGVIYFGLRAFFFGTFLILDRGFGPIEAIQGSWTLSEGHFGWLFVVALLMMLIVFGGLVLCIVGVLFTVPLVQLTLTAGYLLIVGKQPLSRPAPQPPAGGNEEAYYAR